MPRRWPLLLLAVCASSGVHAETLRAAVERAWTRSVAAAVAEARREEVAASRQAGAAWLPGAPSVGVARRDDRLTQRRGGVEHELEVAVPLWLPGQRAARQALAEAEAGDGEGAREAARLEVAGAVRDALWAWRQARAELTLAEERQRTAETLAGDVARRVAAGELARADALLARQEMLQADAGRVAAGSRLERAAARYGLLTGQETDPADAEEAVQAPPPQHPRLMAADAAVGRARAALNLVRESEREAPSLGVQWRRERADPAAAADASVRFALNLPLASAARHRPQLAAAGSVLAEAEAARRRLLDELAADLRAARAELAAAEAAAALAEARAEAAGERLRLLDRAFALGELPLPEYLRTRQAAFEARAEAVQRGLARHAARAQLNQIQGVLP